MKCEADECDRAPIAFGLCDKHYRRLCRHGDPNVAKAPASLQRKPRLVFLLAHKDWHSSECLRWPFSKSFNGYGRFTDGDVATTAHRKMCELVHGAPPAPSMDAAHSCGNRDCVNPHHLSWKTKKANQADRVVDGTMIFGRANPNAKLREIDVIEIRRLGANGQTHGDIASRFGVERAAVSKILRGERWAWLKSNAKHFKEGTNA